jgi:putative transposase
MARAKRHYIPGHVWHITHRCHKREFLLKFAKDRRRWLQWLFEAKRRYGLAILDYIVTSNHIHLLVYDGAGQDVVPRSIQLVAGRTGQEYNERKIRKGAFWQDRYHATAVESGEHLLRCIVYIDLNMVRAGVVDHPSGWPFGGYKEIQAPRRKCVLIDYEKLRDLVGVETYDQLRASHKGWVDEALTDGNSVRESKWTSSIAVGSQEFVESTKAQLGIRARGRSVRKTGGSFELREPNAVYFDDFGHKNDVIGLQNTHFWNTCS